ncbi:MAG: TetR/AcrR family transcriptional regulator [Anaerolineae bacterium]|nr:TetR/AcrR family transcriptional regulator [Anaerolineae bacterium]
MTKRQYRGTAQAEVAALTRQRILEATVALANERWVDEITLEDIAEKSGVTAQTILRHFGSKDGLATEAARTGNHAVLEQRNAAIAGDLENITSNLTEHYEAFGERVFRTLAQDATFPQFKAFLQEGRHFHRQWVERVFAPWLQKLSEAPRERLTLQLIAVCDVHLWRVYRHELSLSSEDYRALLLDLLRALLNQNMEQPS